MQAGWTDKILHRLGVHAYLKRWRRATPATLRARVRRLAARWRADAGQRRFQGRLPTLLDRDRVGLHVLASVARSRVETDPMPHVVVEDLFPRDYYQLLIETLPAPAFFGDSRAIKSNLNPEVIEPTVSRQVWRFMEAELGRQVLAPALGDKFHAYRRWYCDKEFGPVLGEQVATLPLEMSTSRLMLRRTGYHVAPHRDPKRVFLTCLVYLARPGNNERWGTQLFEVDEPPARGSDDRKKTHPNRTYYPEHEGPRCRLVRTTPFRENSAVVFVNCEGAHGADIRADEGTGVLRHAYQFYVGPRLEDLRALLKRRPNSRSG